MTASIDGTTEFRALDDGRLSAQCLICGVNFEPLPPADVGAALAKFDVHYALGRRDVAPPGAASGRQAADAPVGRG